MSERGRTHRGQLGGRSATWQPRKVGEAAANELETIQLQDGINGSQSDMCHALAATREARGATRWAVGSTHSPGEGGGGRDEADLEPHWTGTDWTACLRVEAYKATRATQCASICLRFG